jgi:hypothetical protein
MQHSLMAAQTNLKECTGIRTGYTVKGKSKTTIIKSILAGSRSNVKMIKVLAQSNLQSE